MSSEIEVRITKLREQAQALLNKATELESQQHTRQMDAHVGKYFKYRNSYSCPRIETDYWWLYAAIRKRGQQVVAIEFQRTRDGKLEFETRPFFLSDAWKEISRREFMLAYRRARKEVEAIASL